MLFPGHSSPFCDQGHNRIVDKTINLQDFFRVYSSENVNPNVLCLSDVEDMCKVICIPSQAFVVNSPGYDMKFRKQG